MPRKGPQHRRSAPQRARRDRGVSPGGCNGYTGTDSVTALRTVWRALQTRAGDGPLLRADVSGGGVARPAPRSPGVTPARCRACGRRVVWARLRKRWTVTETMVPLEPAPPVYVLERPYLNRRVVCRRAGSELVRFYLSHAGTCPGRHATRR